MQIIIMREENTQKKVSRSTDNPSLTHRVQWVSPELMLLYATNEWREYTRSHCSKLLAWSCVCVQIRKCVIFERSLTLLTSTHLQEHMNLYETMCQIAK